MTKIAGSGSISQRHRSADPDPYQNATDPQHWTQDNTAGKKDGCLTELKTDLFPTPPHPTSDAVRLGVGGGGGGG